jgi:acetyl-CoA carboxylase carboxyl transferase subunit beta
MSWLQKLLPPKIKRTEAPASKTVPEGLWSKCPACEAVLYSADLEKNLNVCPKCGHHNGSARARASTRCSTRGPLRDRRRGAAGRRAQVQGQPRTPSASRRPGRTGETDALVVMQGAIKSLPVVWRRLRVRVHGRLDGLGGRRALRARRAASAIEQKLPFICVHRLGGARMQEGLLSLMQMAKTTAALTELSAERAALHLGADRSDDGRRVGELRHDRRRRDRRAEAR